MAAASAATLQVEMGVGGESQSSPLVRLSPQGALIELPGLMRARSNHGRLGLQGLREWSASPGNAFTLAGSALLQRADGQRDFDLGMATLQPAWQRATPLGSFSVGWQWQRIDLAGRRFRRAAGPQITWTRAGDGTAFETLILDAARLSHAPALRDLDAESLTLSGQARRGSESLSVDLGLVLGRERNRRGLPELSYEMALVQASVQARLAGATLGLGLARQGVRYQASAFDALPPRRDRAWMVDASVTLDAGADWQWRASAAWQLNRSNARLYDQRHLQWGLAALGSW